MSERVPAALVDFAARHGLEPSRLQAALDWQVSLWSGEMGADERRAWAAWLSADAGNQRAWTAVERLAGRLGDLPDDVARHSLKRPVRVSRRQALGLAGLAGVGALVARSDWTARAVADCRSGAGEQRSLTLPDGSGLMLNTASAVNLDFAADRRLRVLAGSEIALDRRRVSAGPLRIEMSDTRLEAGSGHVALRDHGDRLRVALLDGTLRVLPRRAGGTATTLKGGEAAWVSAHGVRRSPLATDHRVLDWTRGVLRVDRQPLAAFLAELGRYRHGFLYCDDAVSSLVVSGAFRIDNTDFALQSLAQALPVAVHYRTPWLVKVGPLDNAAKKNAFLV